jgi:magnesium chelatase subunit D
MDREKASVPPAGDSLENSGSGENEAGTGERQNSTPKTDIPIEKTPGLEKNSCGDGNMESNEYEEEFDIGPPLTSSEILFPPVRERSPAAGQGRRNIYTRTTGSGQFTGSRIPRNKATDIAVAATLAAAAPYQKIRREGQHTGHSLIISPSDLREKIRKRRSGAVILFCVDGSGSMGADRRMVETKGAVLSLLMESYKNRDTIGMVVFRGTSAELVLPPTRSVYLAYKLLKELSVGGATPICEGLVKCGELVYGMRAKNETSRPSVILITDGKNNSTKSGGSPEKELTFLAEKLARDPVRFAVIDTESGWIRYERAKSIAQMLNARYVHLDNFRQEEIVGMVNVVRGNGR